MLKLRDYQQKIHDETYDSWRAGNHNVLLVLPTGAGKTVIFAKVLSDHPGRAIAIAHRQELVSQISMALASWGVDHNILAPNEVIRLITRKHLKKFNRTFFNPNSNKTVAGVDTLRARGASLANWLKMQTLWIMDEAHHILTSNKWGSVVAQMRNAKGLGVTATPLRADGKGLSRATHGVFDDMLVGPSMRDLINDNYLTDYVVYRPPSDLDLSSVSLSKTTGDYSKNKLALAVAKSHIVGDIVEHYIRYASGKLGITFTTDVSMASEIAKKFNRAGVPAEVVSHRTTDVIRSEILERFERRDLMQLVNVDLFGEGFDLPAIEVVSFARPTESYALFAQQFGRALRLSPNKDRAVILDHVGNVVRHGLPDRRTHWSLEARSKTSTTANPDEIPTRICSECLGVYERVLTVCPYCGKTYEAAERGGPERVDGELTLMETGLVDKLTNEARILQLPDNEYRDLLIRRNCPAIGIERNVKLHARDRQMQKTLAAVILVWNSQLKESEIQKRFYWQFKIDLLTARTLKYRDAKNLARKIMEV